MILAEHLAYMIKIRHAYRFLTSIEKKYNLGVLGADGNILPN
jgi:hypothetical protein